MSHPPPRAWPRSSPGTHGCSNPRELLALGVSGLLPPASGVALSIPLGCASRLAWQWEPQAIQTLPCPSCPTLLSNQTPASSRSQGDGRYQAKHLHIPHPCRTDSSWDLLPLIFSLPSPQTRAPTGDLFYWLFIATVMASVRTVSSAQMNTAEFSILLLVITA